MSLSVPEGAVQSYEALRPDLLQPRATATGNGRTLLIRRGMLAWACERGDALSFPPTPLLPTVQSEVPSGIAGELVRIMAGLILSRGKECVHARIEGHGFTSGA